ncbi:MAG: PP2C family serine/threonine-protein phosphatase [Eubacterium sp.]
MFASLSCMEVVEMWTTIQCAVQGRSHIKANIPCQDKTYTVSLNGIQVIALADGAGSAKLSHYGAEAVTVYICTELSEKFDYYFTHNDGAVVKQQLMAGIGNCLSEKTKQLECELKDLSSTLLFVAVKDDRFIIAHIGDGVIGYLKNNELKVASQPENGEFVNTTVFTTSKEALVTMKLIKGNLGQINGFVLMSDGTEAGLYNKREKKLADVLKKIMQMTVIISADKVQEQLQHSFETIISQATMDDCSIVILMNDCDVFKGYNYLSDMEKCELINISITGRNAKKRLKRYDDILLCLQNQKSLKEVARCIHLKPKYAKKYIIRLLSLNLIEKQGCNYHTLIIMEK